MCAKWPDRATGVIVPRVAGSAHRLKTVTEVRLVMVDQKISGSMGGKGESEGEMWPDLISETGFVVLSPFTERVLL